MRKFFAKLFKTIITTTIILSALTGLFLCVIGFVGLDFNRLDLDELLAVRSAEELEDWYFGEIGDIVVGEAVVVESVSYDRYAYQQLDQVSQQVYDQVYNCIINHEDKVTLSSVDIDVLKVAYESVMADYGSLFWVNGYQYNTYKSKDRVVGLEFAPKYTMSRAQRDYYQNQVDAKVREWLAEAPASGKDFDKALYVFETLINKVDYDVNSKENQNILSVFLNQSTVCQGYADAAWYLLEELGINTTIITGRANGESHAWNLVYLDGAYYFMDVTWGNSKYLNMDNSTKKRVNYAYMAMSSEEICQTHTIDTSFEVVECLSTADNYFVHGGLYFDTFDKDSIGWTLQKSYDAKEAEISIKLSSNEVFQQTCDYFFEEKHIADYCRGINSIYYIMDDNAYVITVQW